MHVSLNFEKFQITMKMAEMTEGLPLYCVGSGKSRGPLCSSLELKHQGKDPLLGPGEFGERV